MADAKKNDCVSKMYYEIDKEIKSEKGTRIETETEPNSSKINSACGLRLR